jgi:hypothetical protein
LERKRQNDKRALESLFNMAHTLDDEMLHTRLFSYPSTARVSAMEAIARILEEVMPLMSTIRPGSIRVTHTWDTNGDLVLRATRGTGPRLAPRFDASETVEIIDEADAQNDHIEINKSL